MDQELASLQHTVNLVLALGFAIGLAFGAVAQHTRFCTMGAIADRINFGDGTRLRQWVLAAVVALLGTQALIAAGTLDLSASFYVGAKLTWLSHLLGGTLFGFGMVLASGCGSRNLVRAGAGSLKAVVVVLVLGLAAQMTMRGAFAPLRVETLDAVALTLAGPQDLPSWLARATTASAGLWRVALAALVAVAAGVWLWRDAAFRGDRAAQLGGAAIGLLVVAAWWSTARLGFVPEHPQTLEPAWPATDSRRPEAMSFVAPVANTLTLLTLWSDKGTTLSFAIALVLGVPLGSAAVALATRSFRWEGFRDAGDLSHHLVGAVLMGFGGVTALGCTVGQGLSGLSLMAPGAALACAGFGIGAALALRYQAWRIEREA
ncbi:YeeE/YedE family protein [Caldimonas sp. KR1-144]|uniref:YeeE/YedE family protein n=1 Tax=Caldimonas sp. KR1-144 TaxID=3400911 RepID=UPI003C000B10